MADKRQAHDLKDTYTVLNYLHERKPFCPDPSLRSVSTGVYAHITVNIDKAKFIGNTIFVRIIGQITADYIFKKRDQSITLSTESAMKIGGKAIHVDPQLLFQRLQLLQKHQEVLYPCSSMSCVVVHQYYLTPHCNFDSHRNQC